MAKQTRQATPFLHLFLAALVGLLIGVGSMVKLNKNCFNSWDGTSLSNGDDVPSLEKEFQKLKSTNPFNN